MIELPDSFIESASRNMPGGRDWIQTLPRIHEACTNKWGLHGLELFGNLGSNLVSVATSDAFGDVVLKIQGPHESRHTEAAALRAYAGRSACELLDVYGEEEALLLERLLPGTSLRSIQDKGLQLEVGCNLITTLPVLPPDPGDFPTYSDWIDNAFEKAREEYNAESAMRDLMSQAEDTLGQIFRLDPSSVLLHGDLHHENIVSCPDGVWKAIDPQGVLGPACLECGRFIQNHLGDAETGSVDVDLLDQTIKRFSDRLGMPSRVISGSVFVLDVLSTAWGYEMNYTTARLHAGMRRSETILSHLRKL